MIGYRNLAAEGDGHNDESDTDQQTLPLE